MVKLLAPKDFSTPIMEVRSMMIISRPDTMVNPATPIIRMRMTQMLTSKMPSQAKIWGLSCSTLRTQYSAP